MTWTPSPTLQNAVSLAFTRAGETASHERSEAVRAGRADLAARGMGSGALIQLRETAGVGAVKTFGGEASREIIRLIETAYGDVPAEAIPWIRTTLRTRVQSFASSMGISLEEARRKAHLPTDGARGPVLHAANEVVRDLELELAKLELRQEGKHRSMKLPRELFGDRLKVIKKTGQIFDGVVATVQRGTIMFPDASVPIEDGDEIERSLPGNVTERFRVIDAGYTPGVGPVPAHYQAHVSKGGALKGVTDSLPSQTTIYNITGDQARVNVNSTDKSTNVISVDSATMFASMKEAVSKGDLDDRLRSELVARIEAMEAHSASRSFVHRYNEFMSIAADHLQVFGPFLPALAQLLLKTAGL